MPHSSANPNRKRLPGRGDWLLSYLKSVSPPCPHAAALGSAGEVAKCPLCNPVASHCNPVAFLLCTHCNPAAFLLCTRCNCTACPQPCTPEKGDAKSRMQWFLLGFACPAVPGRSLQQEWGIDALPQALLLGAAREMKQHLITQHVGRLQSCQDNHASVPWDTQPCSELSAEQQCGTAEPAYCKGHQECCNPCNLWLSATSSRFALQQEGALEGAPAPLPARGAKWVCTWGALQAAPQSCPAAVAQRCCLSQSLIFLFFLLN